MSTQQTDMDGAQSMPVITPATLGAVRKMMEQEGIVPQNNQQVSEYVEKLVARESFFQIVETIQERNKEVDPQEIASAIGQAIAEIKADRGKHGASADRT